MVRWFSNLILAFQLTISLTQANGQITNGSFETWVDGTPVGWTQIDSGISISKESSLPSYLGSYSAAVTVNTTKQASTDFRQLMHVVKGFNYYFSVSVYHTEGHVAARIYVDGYQRYSDPSVTGAWQTINHSYTASATGTIEVGLRFYDTSGFDGSETVLIDGYSVSYSGQNDDLGDYYSRAEGLEGYSLKSALFNIISGHADQGYDAIWSFFSAYDLDAYYEQDENILDIYSENNSSADPYEFIPSSDQCGNYTGEGSCYNREHSFPKSWFGGKVAPMFSDVHHIYPTDGYVNAKRGNYPYGDVGTVSYTSSNGSKLGIGSTDLGYTGTVFEPIDSFKGDVARSYFYMATRYEDVIASWQGNSTYGDTVLDGSKDQVFEPWFLKLLLAWHQMDPVSQKEIDRNRNAYTFQGNRNPFVDHPEYAKLIWQY